MVLVTLNSLPLPPGFVDLFDPVSQPLSAALDRLVVRAAAAVGRFEPGPEACFGMESYLRVRVPSGFLPALRLERGRPRGTVFFRGFPLEGHSLVPDVVDVVSDVFGGCGVVPPLDLTPVAQEVYVTLRLDGSEPGEALSLAKALCLTGLRDGARCVGS